METMELVFDMAVVGVRAELSLGAGGRREGEEVCGGLDSFFGAEKAIVSKIVLLEDEVP
jgi:hypothetical protein